MGPRVRILFFSDNFPPETNAPATRLYEHASHWVSMGHEVTVLTGAPNFPEGKVYPGYRNRLCQIETIDGIRVVRVKTYITANEGFFKRTIDYMSFMAASFIAGLFQPRPDVVVATSPQFFAAVGGWALSSVRGLPFVFELRDLWPSSIAAVGAMRSGFIIKALEKVEVFLYSRASLIISVTKAFKRDLVARGIDPSKISIVGNGVNLDKLKPGEKDRSLAQNYGLSDAFVVGYIGTHGMAHALNRVLDAAESLKDVHDLRFLFVGSGATKESLVMDAKKRGLNNVIFVPNQAKDSIQSFLRLCDISLITLKNTPVFETVIPSKIFESMGMGLPIIIACPRGEASAIVEEEKIGLWIEPENPVALAEAVLFLKKNRALLGAFAKQSREAATRYCRKRLAGNMVYLLEGLVNKKGQNKGHSSAIRQL